MPMTPQLRQADRWLALTRGALIGFTAAGGVLVAACGSAAAPSASHPAATTSAGTSSAGTSSAGTTSAAKVSLTVVEAGVGTSPTRHWTLRCDPPGGTTPDPAAMCTRLLAFKDIFTPAPTHVMCPMIMADARTYIVEGTWFGKQIHESIADGGCSLARWAELGQVFN
jgi:Subtilisin inhibitor-like